MKTGIVDKIRHSHAGASLPTVKHNNTVGAGHARDILAAMLSFSFFIAGMARSYNT